MVARMKAHATLTPAPTMTMGRVKHLAQVVQTKKLVIFSHSHHGCRRRMHLPARSRKIMMAMSWTNVASVEVTAFRRNLRLSRQSIEEWCVWRKGIPEGQCDCEGNVPDECGVCGGEGIPRAIATATALFWTNAANAATRNRGRHM